MRSDHNQVIAMSVLKQQYNNEDTNKTLNANVFGTYLSLLSSAEFTVHKK
jgi:hypothetical protein